MIRNMGNADRVTRILVAVAIAALYFADVITGTAGVILLIVAGVFLLTGLIGVCPLYMPFRLSTKKIKE